MFLDVGGDGRTTMLRPSLVMTVITPDVGIDESKRESQSGVQQSVTTVNSFDDQCTYGPGAPPAWPPLLLPCSFA